ELQGIDAAARVLAGKTPGGLNLSESLVLAALLPAPAASADRVAARACARAAARSLELDCDQLKTTAAELLAKAGQPNLADPDLAPHVARMLLARAGERIQTTLDARLQRMARETLERHLSDLK